MSISNNKSIKIAKAHEDLADSFAVPEKFKDDLCKKDCVYLQPPKAVSVQRKKIYKPSTTKFETETTYKKSYLVNKCSPEKHDSKKFKNVQITGKIDYNTTNQISFKGYFENPVGKIFPRSHLKCGGSANFSSTYSESYINPGIVKTLPIKPIRGKVREPMKMECRTTMNESFKNPGVNFLTVVKPKYKKFVTDAKIDQMTVNRASYQKSSLPINKIYRPKRRQLCVSTKIEGDTIYKSSYKPPGCCVSKNEYLQKIS